MSLSSFLEQPDVMAVLKPLRPESRRKIDVPIKVEPRSGRYILVGTAFDYLLRFELQRGPRMPWRNRGLPSMAVTYSGTRANGTKTKGRVFRAAWML